MLDAAPSPLIWLASELLRLLEVSVPEGADLAIEPFKERLRHFALQPSESNDVTRPLREEILSACKAFYERRRHTWPSARSSSPT